MILSEVNSMMLVFNKIHVKYQLVLALLVGVCFDVLYLVFDQDFGKCPVTGETLTIDDLVPIKTGKVCSH